MAAGVAQIGAPLLKPILFFYCLQGLNLSLQLTLLALHYYDIHRPDSYSRKVSDLYSRGTQFTSVWLLAILTDGVRDFPQLLQLNSVLS